MRRFGCEPDADMGWEWRVFGPSASSSSSSLWSLIFKQDTAAIHSKFQAIPCSVREDIYFLAANDAYGIKSRGGSLLEVKVREDRADEFGVEKWRKYEPPATTTLLNLDEWVLQSSICSSIRMSPPGTQHQHIVVSVQKSIRKVAAMESNVCLEQSELLVRVGENDPLSFQTICVESKSRASVQAFLESHLGDPSMLSEASAAGVVAGCGYPRFLLDVATGNYRPSIHGQT
eukprot:GILJ01004410.1.p1 GENE.GILJ01004410.1~~GILJ01004410.1.p1  ORF type:complete len:231 (+),score=17.99 GILJ01004410.1:40-732(+)